MKESLIYVDTPIVDRAAAAIGVIGWYLLLVVDFSLSKVGIVCQSHGNVETWFCAVTDPEERHEDSRLVVGLQCGIVSVNCTSWHQLAIAP